MMTRTLSPDQIEKLAEPPEGGRQARRMPGLEIRYLAFNTEAPAVKDKAVRQAIAAARRPRRDHHQGVRRPAEPLYSLVPTTMTGHTNSFFNKYGDANNREGQRPAHERRDQHPGEADAALHDRPLRHGHERSSRPSRTS